MEERRKEGRHAGARVAAILLLLVLAGCYREVPVPLGGVSPTDRIRLSLSPAGTDQVAEIVGSRESRIRGRLTATSDTSVSVLVRSVSGGGRGSDLYQEVRLARADVLGVGRLELDRTRTGILGVAAAAAAVAILVNILSGEGGSTTEIPEPPTTEAVNPLYSGATYLRATLFRISR